MYRVNNEIPTSHLHVTQSYTLRQLTPEDSPGTLSTVSIGWYCSASMKSILPSILTKQSKLTSLNSGNWLWYLYIKTRHYFGFRWNHVVEKCNHWNNIEATSEQIQCCRPIRRTLVEFKNIGWTKLKFYLYQNEDWFILNKKKKKNIYIYIFFFILNIVYTFTNW